MLSLNLIGDVLVSGIKSAAWSPSSTENKKVISIKFLKNTDGYVRYLMLFNS
jgi:hypothetical protein